MSPIGRPHDPEAFEDRLEDPSSRGPGHPRRPDPPRPDAPRPDDDVVDVMPDPEAPEEPAEPGSAPGPARSAGEEPSIEDLLGELETVIVQRDDYLELARSKQADFENFRKQAAKRQLELTEQAAAGLVKSLLPVLDALDNGVEHGDDSLVAVRTQLLGLLEKEGLVRVDPTDDVFDPNEHDAVAHEAGDGGEPSVAETLRAGYRWNGRLVRPAMVRVRS